MHKATKKNQQIIVAYIFIRQILIYVTAKNQQIAATYIFIYVRETTRSANLSLYGSVRHVEMILFQSDLEQQIKHKRPKPI